MSNVRVIKDFLRRKDIKDYLEFGIEIAISVIETLPENCKVTT